MDDPPVFLDAGALAELRENAAAGALPEAIGEARAEADAVLRGDVFTITRKTRVPPSGDKRDYYSLGPYWWPNPETADGLPYVRRDGVVNPESLQTDRQMMEGMTAAAQTLAIAWHLTSDREYAVRAAELLRVFFVDDATRMNPNLNFGQAVPGHCEGRGIGIIDTRQLPGLLESVRLLRGADVVDEEPLKVWFREYARWLRESPLGMAEANEHNNHGTWYDVQVAAFAVYVGDTDLATRVIAEVPARRFNKHLESDGSQPHEIARTLGLSYSTMNLLGFVWLARLGDRVGIDLWNHAAGGKNLRKAVDYLVLYWLNPTTWQGQQIKAFESRTALPILLTAARVWNDPRYTEVANQIGVTWHSHYDTTVDVHRRASG
jgi:hypothetical protein